MPTETLNVSLTGDLAAFVEEKKQEGYASASEVVRESLRLHARPRRSACEVAGRYSGGTQ